MHKKGITEEVAKKRSRKTVKHQRGIVGADLAAIAAKRNQTTQVRTQQRLAAITKAKAEKKEKEAKKPKVRWSCLLPSCVAQLICAIAASTRGCPIRLQECLETGRKGRQGWSLSDRVLCC